MWEVQPSRARLSAALVGFLGVTLLVPSARSEEPKLSISGYDQVAYFTDGKPVQGKTDFEYLWHKLRWRFASGDHRELFVKNPDRYTPQYDGYCAMGVSAGEAGHKDTVDPEAWAIVDGKLYLTHMLQAMDAWRRNPADYIKQADEKLGSGQGSSGAGGPGSALPRLPAFDTRRDAQRQSLGRRRPRSGPRRERQDHRKG